MVMVSLNRVMLIGRLGRDPEVRTFDDGGKLVTFSVATSDRFRDRMGEWQERTEWHNVVIRFPRLAETAEKYLRKGMLILIEGELRYREYTPKDQPGERRRVAEIFCRNFTMLESKGATSGEAPAGGAPKEAPASGAAAPAPESEENGEDLPF